MAVSSNIYSASRYGPEYGSGAQIYDMIDSFAHSKQEAKELTRVRQAFSNDTLNLEVEKRNAIIQAYDSDFGLSSPY